MSLDSQAKLNKRSLIIALWAGILLLVTVMLGASLGVLTRAQFAEVEESWTDYAEIAEQKGILISGIRGHLGYGGFIHHFKNYVLRQDEVYLQAAQRQLVLFHEHIAQYQSLPTAEAEDAALQTLSLTIQQYESMIATAVQAAENGWPPTETDALVRIDDTAALVALSQLEANGRDVLAQGGARIASAVQSGRQLIWIGFMSIFALMLAALGIGYLIFLLIRGLRDANTELATELTVRKRLERSESRLTTAVEQSPATILITDTNARIQYVNAKFEELSGWTLAEVRGKTPSFLQSGNTDPETYAMINDHLVAGQSWSGTFRNLKKDGSSYWAETTILPLLDPDGGVRNFIGIGEDVTEKRLAREQVVRAQKLEAVGLLAGGVAHDFNNILTTIIGASHLAAMDAPEGSDIAVEIDQIGIAARRARGIVNELLTFARREPGESRPVDLKAVIEEVVGLLRASLPNTISVETECPQSMTIIGDQTHLHQIVMNLCRNAAEAIAGKRGQINISLQRSGDDTIELTVRDDGPGMSEEVRARLFEPFFTTKPIGKGSGLGLAVVFGLVEDMQGKIDVESNLGSGSTFTVTFPAADELASELATQKQDIPKGTERVMLVDDEGEVVEILRRMLLRLGYRVEAYTSPTAAFERLRKSPDAYDLVISDIVMAELNGVDLVREIRANRPDIPIIFCSAYKPDVVEIPGPKPVMMAKPVEPEILAIEVRRLLDAQSKSAAR